jgi:HEAT repeat protein
MQENHMSRVLSFRVVGLVLAGNLLVFLRTAGGAEKETELIAVLRSAQPPDAKDRACWELRQIGTARAVPALQALLTDDVLSHSARCALETMPCPEAGAALRAVLAKTRGPIQAGIIDSLGLRRDREALPALTSLLVEMDMVVVTSAAAALGRIGGLDAVDALFRTTTRGDDPELSPVIADALLRCAEQARASGDMTLSYSIYERLFVIPSIRTGPGPFVVSAWRHWLEKQPHVRTAAFRGLALTAGQDTAAVVRKGLTGSDHASLLAALQLIREIPGASLTKTIAACLPELSPPIQAGVIEGLRQRGDRAAVPALLAATASPVEAVCVTAWRALGELAEASTVPAMVEALGKGKRMGRQAAREALARLRGVNVCDAILKQLPGVTPDVQAELILVLGLRQEPAAAAALLKFAARPDQALRKPALEALAQVADATAMGDLVKLLFQADSDSDRNAIEKALIAACSRNRWGEASGVPLLKALPGASIPVHCALLRVAGHLGGSETLKVLRTATQDPNPAIQDTAVRTLADAGGLEAASDLLRLTQEMSSLHHRLLALRGYWRVVALAEQRLPEERLKMCASGLAASTRPEDKKLGLTELAKVPHVGIFPLVMPLLDDSAVREEAALAIVQVGRRLAGSHPEEVKAALKRLLAVIADSATREQAAEVLKHIETLRDSIQAWQVAGPYLKAGSNYAALFDIAFPPEQPKAKDVTWRLLTENSAISDAAGGIDLLQLIGGEQRVAYARTRIYSDREQPARLELGSDDGVKVWWNGQLVHANNTARPLRPGSDKADVTLQRGWNTLLLKITQNNLGWGFCVRLVKRDGGHLEGLRVDATR